MRNVFFGILVWLLYANCKAVKDPCEGLEDGTRLSHAIQCDRFVICKGQRMFSVGKCPRGLHFNRRLGVCDFKQRARCDVALVLPSLGIESRVSECCGDCCGCCNKIPSPDVSSVPDAASLPAALSTPDAPALPYQPLTGPSGTNCSHKGVCEGQPDGAMFPDPGSNGYIVCQCECEIAMPCPSGLIFNSVLKVCDWPESTSGTLSTPTTTTPTSVPSSTATIASTTDTSSTPTESSTPDASSSSTSDTPPIPIVTSTTSETSSTTSATFPSDTSTKPTESSTPDTSPTPTVTSFTTSSDISSTAMNTSTQDTSTSTSGTDPSDTSSTSSVTTTSSAPSSTSNTTTTLPDISTSAKPSTPSGPATGPSGTTCNNKGVCDNQPDGAMFSDPDSNGYIVCQCECEIPMPCPSGLIFNSVLKVCDWPSSADQKPIIPSTGPSGTVCNNKGKCDGQKDGTLFSDPKSSGYIVCQCECEISMPCPGGLVFNPNVNVCDWPMAFV
ncbi:PREDICTED: uncharacterized protein PB18E9.04c-like [Rhagoletis zephyria]|uniref:uncharacterized protein PB18E9.04c-like n=1 Tax=Rhagoletis zephyria TaxID=28612 RepID=UPI0008115A18|nr:PREDICTED: uncharacterized protein PB18E9.04c-like [Rhagoletis zephyria]